MVRSGPLSSLLSSDAAPSVTAAGCCGVAAAVPTTAGCCGAAVTACCVAATVDDPSTGNGWLPLFSLLLLAYSGAAAGRLEALSEFTEVGGGLGSVSAEGA